MEEFPSPLERTVASALLLLSTTPPSLSSPKSDSDGEALKDGGESKNGDKSLSAESNDFSKSCSSSVTNDCSCQGVRAHKLRIIAVVARCHEMKMKVVRKRRTKVYWISDLKKVTDEKSSTVSTGSESTETSCLSTSSSAVSCAQSHHVTSGEEKQGMSPEEKPRKNYCCSNHISRRAESILRMLSGGCSSEVRIRQVLGDSPDTSKALRMLLKLEEVKRSGAGGRHDPYIYTIARGSQSG